MTDGPAEPGHDTLAYSLCASHSPPLTGLAAGYRRREPEDTALYAVLASQLETFLDQARIEGLPTCRT